MKTVLAIDTSGGHTGLALLAGGELTESVIHSPDSHSSVLLGAIQTLLRRAGVRLEAVDIFAAAAGPGSFTGVRVALAAAKGFAVALGKPMAAVSNLQALAWFGERPLRAAAADARRGDTYVALYDAALAPVRPEVVARLDAWLASLPPEERAVMEIVTPDADHLAGRAMEIPVRVIEPGNLARAVAHLALGRPVDPALTDANYVRRADANLQWVDK